MREKRRKGDERRVRSREEQRRRGGDGVQIQKHTQEKKGSQKIGQIKPAVTMEPSPAIASVPGPTVMPGVTPCPTES
eukprot:749143-Hanusia_phi.AAC.2